MFFCLVILFCGFFSFLIHFNKKLLSLLMIEICFIGMVYLFYFCSFGSFGVCSFFSMMVFLGFLVMDSVLGLCLLVVSCRNSNSFLDSFFNC